MRITVITGSLTPVSMIAWSLTVTPAVTVTLAPIQTPLPIPIGL